MPETIRCAITGTGLFTPTESISNDELVETFNAYIDNHFDDDENKARLYSSTEFIKKASGIESRYVMNKAGVLDPHKMRPEIGERKNDTLSIQAEMAVAAAKEALAAANRSADDIDCVIVACSNMQRPYPAIAIEVQNALGIQGFAYDMNVACSSATFGIANAVATVQAGMAKAVLMVNPEICSGHLDFRDRDCHFIFGDACTAVVIEAADHVATDTYFDILGCELTTEFSNNIRNNYGFLNRAAPDGVGTRDKLFVQNGRKVFKEVCPKAADHILTHLRLCDMSADGVKRLWLHQANLSMNELIAKRVMGRTPTEAEAPVILDKYANTSSAGSVIAFHQYQDDLAPGDTGVICSFGAGYSIGSVVVRKQTA